MQKLRQTSLMMMILLAAVTACVMPTVSWTDPSLQATPQALTIEAAIRGTQQAMGRGTATAVRDETPTASTTASPTASVTATTDSSVYVLNRAEFASVLDTCPRFSRFVLDGAVRRTAAAA